MSQEESELNAEKQAYIDKIKSVYKGVQCFVDMHRVRETGETHILLFDLDRDPLEPVYSVAIHPRDILICGDGLTLPILTFAQWKQFMATGKPPEGEWFIPANYDESALLPHTDSAPPPHTDADAPQDEAAA